MYRKIVFLVVLLFLPIVGKAQFNTDRLVTIGRSALYYEDYVLSIQYFNQAIGAKPYLYEPWFYRAVAKYYLDDYVGAENDCTEAININPFVVNIYELRGLSRIQQKKYGEAVEDYSRALKYAPENQGLWHNRILCRIQQKDYEAAQKDMDTMLTKWSRYARGYSMRAEVFLLQKDTTKAIEALDKSISLDSYDASTWAMYSVINLSRSKWKDAEANLDRAIHLQPKNAGYYINRALTRVNRNNLRGAMADYDMALDLDPNNFLGHYNRGLLRAQVGDDNRAIVDFDFVLEQEPDNIMALFNRALLLDKTGDLRAAIRDYSKVIKEYPNFWTGLHYRAACYRRLGMTKQAEADEFRIYKAQLYKHLYGTQPRLSKKQLRKRSDIDPDKYNQLVVADEQEIEHEYESDYRGRVQNRKVDMAFLPMYELAYEQYHTEVKPYIAYDRKVDEFNRETNTSEKIYINSNQTVLDEERSRYYFAYIDSVSIVLSNTNSIDEKIHLYLNRAVAYSVMQNFAEAINDLSLLISVDSTSSLGYWQRSVCQFKLNEFNEALHDNNGTLINAANVLSDLAMAIKYNPQCAYLYYNRANVYASRKDYAKAIEDYTHAISFDKNLAEAYYNRGLANLLSDKREEGIRDLSKAGELGLYKAYGVIKKYRK